MNKEREDRDIGKTQTTNHFSCFIFKNLKIGSSHSGPSAVASMRAQSVFNVDSDTQKWAAPFSPEGWLSCPTSSVRFYHIKWEENIIWRCLLGQWNLTRVRHNCQCAFTSLCKVWWILWMLASVVKWEFSWKSGARKIKTKWNARTKARKAPPTREHASKFGTSTELPKKVTSWRKQATIRDFRLYRRSTKSPDSFWWLLKYLSTF